MLRRPLQLLYPLEVNCKHEEEMESEQESNVQMAPEFERPTRNAAVAGEQVMRRWIKDMNKV